MLTRLIQAFIDQSYGRDLVRRPLGNYYVALKIRRLSSSNQLRKYGHITSYATLLGLCYVPHKKDSILEGVQRDLE